MKRIQIRFISLTSEKFFSAKRAHPSWEYLREFSKNFETVLIGYTGAGETLIDKKKPEAKNLVTLSLYGKDPDLHQNRMPDPVRIQIGIQNFANTARALFSPLKSYLSLFYHRIFNCLDFIINPSNVEVGTIGLTESEAVAQYGVDKVSVYETAFTAMYFALTSRKQV